MENPAGSAQGEFGPAQKEPPWLEPEPSRYNSTQYFPKRDVLAIAVEKQLLWWVVPLTFAKAKLRRRLSCAHPPQQAKNAPSRTWKLFLLKDFMFPNHSLKDGVGASPGCGFLLFPPLSFQPEMPQTLKRETQAEV